MSNLTKLAAKVEALTGPDREVDCLVHCAVKGWAVVYEGKNVFADMGEGMRRILVGWLDPGKEQRSFSMTSDSLAPLYTASLDAAMSLVPEGWRIRQLEENWLSGRWHSQLTPRPSAKIVAAFDEDKTIGYDSKDAEAATGPLAITAAALRARSATEASDAA